MLNKNVENAGICENYHIAYINEFYNYYKSRFLTNIRKYKFHVNIF